MMSRHKGRESEEWEERRYYYMLKCDTTLRAIEAYKRLFQSASYVCWETIMREERATAISSHARSRDSGTREGRAR